LKILIQAYVHAVGAEAAGGVPLVAKQLMWLPAETKLVSVVEAHGDACEEGEHRGGKDHLEEGAVVAVKGVAIDISHPEPADEEADLGARRDQNHKPGSTEGGKEAPAEADYYDLQEILGGKGEDPQKKVDGIILLVGGINGRELFHNLFQLLVHGVSNVAKEQPAGVKDKEDDGDDPSNTGGEEGEALPDAQIAGKIGKAFHREAVQLPEVIDVGREGKQGHQDAKEEKGEKWAIGAGKHRGLLVKAHHGDVIKISGRKVLWEAGEGKAEPEEEGKGDGAGSSEGSHESLWALLLQAGEGDKEAADQEGQDAGDQVEGGGEEEEEEGDRKVDDLKAPSPCFLSGGMGICEPPPSCFFKVMEIEPSEHLEVKKHVSQEEDEEEKEGSQDEWGLGGQGGEKERPAH